MLNLGNRCDHLENKNPQRGADKAHNSSHFILN